MTLREIVCPMCGTYMDVQHRHGVEIDLCPQCRGVWLDRGELDLVAGRSDPVVDIPGTRPNTVRPGEMRKPGKNDSFEWF